METGAEVVIIILMTLESLEPAPVMPVKMEYYSVIQRNEQLTQASSNSALTPIGFINPKQESV